jgi:uncharacterized protein
VTSKLIATRALNPYSDQREADDIELITRRWVEKVVIGLNLCPFAKAVHAKKQVRYVVTMAIQPDDLLAEVEHEIGVLVDTDPLEVDTTLLIHPLAMLDFLDYHFFVAEADAALKRLEVNGVLQIAGFHPNYCFAGSESNDVANYTNRSPHPMLHLLRESSVAKAVAAFPDAAEIFAGNMARLRQLGLEGLLKL